MTKALTSMKKTPARLRQEWAMAVREGRVIKLDDWSWKAYPTVEQARVAVDDARINGYAGAVLVAGDDRGLSLS